MKDFKYYEKKAEKELRETVIEAFEVLKKDSVTLAVDFTVKSVAELDKTSSRHYIKRISKKKARLMYEEAKKPSLRMIIPVSDSKLNGISLDEGIPLPAYAEMILETNEITETQLIIGLFLMLGKIHDFYYLKILRSFNHNMDIITPELKEMLEGTYWKKRKLSKKVYKKD